MQLFAPSKGRGKALDELSCKRHAFHTKASPNVNGEQKGTTSMLQRKVVGLASPCPVAHYCHHHAMLASSWNHQLLLQGQHFSSQSSLVRELMPSMQERMPARHGQCLCCTRERSAARSCNVDKPRELRRLGSVFVPPVSHNTPRTTGSPGGGELSAPLRGEPGSGSPNVIYFKCSEPLVEPHISIR